MERSVSARLTANVTGLVAGLATAKASVSSFAKETSRLVASNRAEFSKLGTGMLVAGAAVAAGFGLATREAIQWESAFAGVRKTVDDTAEGYDRLERELRDLALVLPASAVEIAGVAEAAGQLNVARGDIVEFTRVMIMLGNTTNLAANDAATGLARFMNIVGTVPEDVGRLGATLVELGNKGASTEAEILAMGLRIAGVATIAGLTEAEVLGLANAMSSLGLEAEAGGTAITRVFTTMDDAVKIGGTALETFAATAGVSASQFAAAYRADPVAALELFLRGLNATTEAGGSLTSTLDSLGLADIRVSDTLRRLAANVDLVTASQVDATGAWKDNNALVEEAAKRYETTESKIQLARNALTDAGIDIGNKLLPVVAQLAGALADLAGWFTDLNPAVQNTALVLIGLIGAGALAGGMALKLIGSLLPIITTLKGVDAAAKITTASLRVLGGVAVLGGIVAVGLGLDSIKKSLEEGRGERLAGDVSATASEIIRLGGAGESTGSILKRFGQNLDDLGPSMRDAAHGFDLAIGSFGKEATVADIEKLDAGLAQLVRDGNLEAAAAGFSVFTEEGLKANLMTAEIVALYPQYADALNSADIDGKMEVEAQALAETERRAAATTDEYGRLVDATGNLIDPTQEMSAEAQHLADKWGLSAGAAIDLAEGIDAIVKATEIATASNRDAQAANIAYESTLTDAKETIKGLIEELAESGGLASILADTATGFDLTSVAGQTLARTALDIANAAHDNADGILAVTDNTADYRTALQDGYDDLVAFYVGLGIGEEKARDLAAAIIDVPDEIPIEVPLTSLEAARLKAMELGGALDAATVDRTVNVQVEWWNTYHGSGGGVVEDGATVGRVGAPAGGGAGAGVSGFGAEFAGATGISGAAWMAGGPGWQQSQTQRVAQPDRTPVVMDLRTINHYPYRREGSDDHMRNIAKASAAGALAAAAMGMGQGTLIVKDA